jgi:microcompartment protein CcmL/EutN
MTLNFLALESGEPSGFADVTPKSVNHSMLRLELVCSGRSMVSVKGTVVNE